MASVLDLHDAVRQLADVTQRLQSISNAFGGATVNGHIGHTATAAAIDDNSAGIISKFDSLVQEYLSKFQSNSQHLDALVKQAGDLVAEAFAAEHDILRQSLHSKEPDQAHLMTLLKPLMDKSQELNQLKDKNRKSEFFNHVSALAEGIQALGWITVKPAPAPFIKEMIDAAHFYTNKVLKDFREKDAQHATWVASWLQVLQKLHDYVKDNHTAGLVWNTAPPAARQASPAAAAAPAPPPPPAAAPPPPPPPPSAPPPSAPPPSAHALLDGAKDVPAGDKSAHSELFADLNRGEDITKRLKKVEKQKKGEPPKAESPKPEPAKPDPAKAHVRGPQPFRPTPPPKPAGLHAAPPHPATPPARPAAPHANAAAPVAPKKNPVFELRNKKWCIEYQEDQQLTVDDVTISQSVYIFRCTNTVVQVKGKLNAITMDSCKKSAVAFDSCVSTVEFVNCQSVKGQVFGVVPTVSIDKTDGCQIYLSSESANAEIVTAKSSELNICLPDGDVPGDFKEYALPEQFKSIWNGKKFNTVAADKV